MKLFMPDAQAVYLRTLTREDATQTYADWLNDPEVNQYLETRFSHQSVESCRDFVETINAKDNEFLFAICQKNSHRHIGNIKVGPINASHKYADVSLFIGEKDCWGQGVGTQAIQIISAYAFKYLDVRRLNAGAYALNKGSSNAFLKVGYQREGLTRQKFIMANGKAVDSVEVGLLKSECTYFEDIILIDE